MYTHFSIFLNLSTQNTQEHSQKKLPTNSEVKQPMLQKTA
jgi:hypothetical protein